MPSPDKELPPVRRWYLIVFLLITLPLVTRDRAAIEPDPWAGTNGMRKLILTMEEIKRRAANYPGDAKLYQAAAAAMMAEISDPYSDFYNEKNRSQVESVIDDTPPGGIGGIFSPVPGFGFRLDTVIPGSAVETAGMRPRDVIVEVDGKELAGLSSQEIQDHLIGPAGSKVALVYARGDERHTVELTRQPFPKRTVSGVGFLPGRPRIGYVHLQVFSHDAAKTLTEAIEGLMRRNARALVLDLRNNSGGEMAAGIAIADLFLSGGIITTVERGDGQGGWRPASDGGNEYRARPGGPFEHVPLAVLVDGVTASAAELVAGALRDNNRAPLIGTKTYGKARVQELLSLGEETRGGALRITAARFLTPKGEDFEGKGLQPTIKVDLTGKEEETLRGNLTTKWLRLPPPISDADEPVIQEAVKYLREKLPSDDE